MGAENLRVDPLQAELHRKLLDAHAEVIRAQRPDLKDRPVYVGFPVPATATLTPEHVKSIGVNAVSSNVSSDISGGSIAAGK